MKTGDVVRHRPSGETWTVAFVEGDELSWCGWPFGYAKIADCDLVEECSREESLSLMREIADRPPGSGERYDCRSAVCRAQLEVVDEVYAHQKVARLSEDVRQAERDLDQKRAALRDAENNRRHLAQGKTASIGQPEKTWVVRFYDSFDGWITLPKSYTKEAAEQEAAAKNVELDVGNKQAGEYYRAFPADTEMVFDAKYDPYRTGRNAITEDDAGA